MSNKLTQYQLYRFEKKSVISEIIAIKRTPVLFDLTFLLD